MEWKQQLKGYTALINAYLEEQLKEAEGLNKTVVEAMRYSLMAGGKRLRPVLMLAAYKLFSEDLNKVLPYAAAIEMIHTYSLIHDDLPAMDNDDYRRGKPTNHKVFGEGIAILAGDGLLNYSYELMLRDAVEKENPRPYLRASYELAAASGINGMIGGQTVDLESESKLISADTLHYIHTKKTAAIISASLKAGAIIGGGTDTDIDRMENIGTSLGLAFQIQDDILDIVGDQEKLGKNIGSDEENQKSTYPAIFGLEHSYKKVRELTEEINKSLAAYGERGAFLVELSRYLMEREA